MTAPRVFLDDIAENPPILAEGKLVLVEVKESKVKFGKDSGDPYINLRVAVTDDPEDEGAIMFDTLPLPVEQEPQESQAGYRKRMDRRCFRLKRAANAFGVVIKGGVEPDEVAEAFLGRKAWCRTKLEKDNRDQDQSRPAEYFPEGERPEES